MKVIKKMTYKIFSKNLKNKKNKLVTYQSYQVVLIADLYKIKKKMIQ